MASSILMWTSQVKYVFVWTCKYGVNVILTSKPNDRAIQVHSDARCPALSRPSANANWNNKSSQ